ncbi:MAG: glycosyltransferase [Acidobacteriaceae bacterium]|nr:glycosyltransferase [Acidobacteriaceae bacterium]
MRVFVCDPGVTSLIGHHYTLNRNIGDALRRRGVDTRILVDQTLDPVVVHALGATPYFTPVPFDLANLDPLCGWMENFLDCAVSQHRDLERLDADRDDVLIFHSGCHRQLLAVADWLRDRAEAERPTVMMLFGANGAISRTGEIQSSVALCLRYAGRRLPKDCQALTLAAQDEAPARPHRFLFNHPVEVVPCPYTATPRRRQHPLVIGFLGHQRPDKGARLLLEIIRGLKSGPNRDLSILVQDSGTENWADGTMTMLSAAGAELQHQVSYEEWPDLVDRIDLLVLPYDPNSGGANHSTVATEALCHGIPAVVPAATGTEDFMHRWGAGFDSFENWNPDAILSAIQQSLAHYPDRATLSYEAALRWQDSQGPDALVTVLLERHARRGPA